MERELLWREVTMENEYHTGLEFPKNVRCTMQQNVTF